jgi:hypothetical protein
MGVDLSRIASSALEAALDDGEQAHQRKRRGSALKAVAAGAALAVAAKAAASKAPRLMALPSFDGLRDIPDRVRDRLADAGWLDDEEDVEDEPVDEEDFDDPEEDEEDEEDEAEEFDEDEEDEFDDEDGEEPAPELELESEDDEDLHPEDRPPQPPRSKAKAS